MDHSPSFLSQQDQNIVLTEKRRNHLRNFIQPLPREKFEKRLSAQGVQNTQVYYARSVRKKNYPYTNTAMPSMHNTPLATRKAKFSEMRESSQDPKRNREAIEITKSLNSLKAA